MRDVQLLHTAFDPHSVNTEFAVRFKLAGGLCSFVGQVRGEGGVQALELSHYEPLTLPGMQEIASRAIERFDLSGLLMLHRVGRMRPGEPIVCVSAAAPHRRGSFQAVDYCMDHLKSAAWFWKRELRGNDWHWIEPRAQDHTDLKRWK